MRLILNDTNNFCIIWENDCKMSLFCIMILENKTNQKILNYLKKSKNIKKNIIETISPDFDQKNIIIL